MITYQIWTHIAMATTGNKVFGIFTAAPQIPPEGFFSDPAEEAVAFYAEK